MDRLSAPLYTLLIFSRLIGATSALTCGQVDGQLSACLAYAKAAGKAPPPGCYYGVRNLVNMTKTTPDRQTTCTYLKNAAGQFPDLNAGLVVIPRKCGVNIPYAISKKTDCTKVM